MNGTTATGDNTTTVNCNNTVTSTCTSIGRNGLVVQELDELVSQQQQEVSSTVATPPSQSSPLFQSMVHHAYQGLHHLHSNNSNNSNHHHNHFHPQQASQPILTPPTSPQAVENGHHRHSSSNVNGDDKENRHCTLLSMNGYHQNGSGVHNDSQLFPDAPTTPKVLRKVAPMYCNFKKVTSPAAAATATVLNGTSNGHGHTDELTTNGHTTTDEGGATTNDVLSPRNGVTVTVTINGDERHASTTRIHICPPD